MNRNYEQEGIVHAIKDLDRAGIGNIVCGLHQSQCTCRTCCNPGSPGATRLVDKPVTCFVCLGLS